MLERAASENNNPNQATKSPIAFQSTTDNNGGNLFDGFRQQMSSSRNVVSLTRAQRLLKFVKHKMKLNRFFLVVGLKKGVSISATIVIIADLIDLLWHLSLTFGPMSTTLSSMLMLETFLVICICVIVLYCIDSMNLFDLQSTLFAWIVIVAIDFNLKLIITLLTLFISKKASNSAKIVRFIEASLMLCLVAHCWLCVFSYFDELNDKTTTVKITPSDDKSRKQQTVAAAAAASSSSTKKTILSTRTTNSFSPTTVASLNELQQQQQNLKQLSASQLTNNNNNNLSNFSPANMLRAPDESTLVGSNRW